MINVPGKSFWGNEITDIYTFVFSYQVAHADELPFISRICVNKLRHYIVNN